MKHFSNNTSCPNSLFGTGEEAVLHLGTFSPPQSLDNSTLRGIRHSTGLYTCTTFEVSYPGIDLEVAGALKAAQPAGEYQGSHQACTGIGGRSKQSAQSHKVSVRVMEIDFRLGWG